MEERSSNRPNPILARKLMLISKSGRKIEYTHVTNILAVGNVLHVHGETDDSDDTRINVHDDHKIDGLHIGIIEFYKPLE